MKKFTKLFFLFILVLALSVSFGVTVFATEGEGAEAETQAPSIPEGAELEYTIGETVTYHKADEFGELVAAGGKIRLLSDIELEIGAITVKKDVTIDLDGHDIKKAFYYGNHYLATYDEATESYTYGTDATYKDATSSAATFFNVAAKNVDLVITSTAGGGTLYHTNIKANTWYSESGEVVKREISGFSVTRLVNMSSSNTYSGSTFTFNGGISIYTDALIVQASGGNHKLTVTLDNVNVYTTSNTVSANSGDYYTFRIESSGNVNVNAKNSTFYMLTTSANAQFIKLAGTTDNSKTLTMTFDNCDILKANSNYRSVISNVKTGSLSKIFFNNCRVYDVAGKNYTDTNIYTGAGTLAYLSTKEGSESYCPPAYDSAFTNITTSVSKTYRVPNLTRNFNTEKNGEIESPSFNVAIKNLTINYNTVITKQVTVNYMNGGELVETKTLYPGADSLAGPEIIKELEDDLYRNLRLQWVDVNGKPIGEDLSFDDVQTYYTAESVGGKYDYVAGIKGAMFNMLYMTHFEYIFYLPIVDGVTINSISGLRAGKDTDTHYISGDLYRYWIEYIEASNSFNDLTVKVNYTVDGQTFTSTIKLSAYLYANIALNSGDHTELDKEATACMVRYVEESYKLVDSDHVLDEALTAKFNAIYEQRTPKDYVTEYPKNEIKDYNEAAVDGLIESVKFGLYNGTRLSFIVTLTDEAVAQGYQVFFNGVSYGIANSRQNGKVWYTNNVQIHKYMMNPNYKISIVTADSTDSKSTTVQRELDLNGDGVLELVNAETSYSLATYCKETDAPIAKALYAFGMAILAVRESIY